MKTYEYSPSGYIREVDLADERLRDAAPDLLALLEIVQSRLQSKGKITVENSAGLVEAIDAAIAKVKEI